MADKGAAIEAEQNSGSEPKAFSVKPGENPAGTDATVSVRSAARRARWAEMVFTLALVLYAALAWLAHAHAYFAWDLRLARLIQSIALPGFDSLMIAVSWIGSGIFPFTVVIATGVALIKTGFKTEAVICMLGSGLGTAVNHLLKFITARPRPNNLLVHVATNARFESFPSGHVTFFVEYFGFLLFLAYVLVRRGRLRLIAIAVFGLLIAIVGVSRVYLGAHWPSDVVGAYLAGGAWLLLMIEIYRRQKARRSA